MANTTLSLTPELQAWLAGPMLREPELLRRLRAETAALPQAEMQIAPEQGQFLQMLVRTVGARRALEVGTFTGYSSLSIALALPADGQLIACDVSDEWTSMARRYWAEAGVASKIELRLAPGSESLDALLAAGETGRFDFAFIDADKLNYDRYYEACLKLVRPGGLIVLDNMLWGGRVIDREDQSPETVAIRALNEKIQADGRVYNMLVPIGDGLHMAYKL